MKENITKEFAKTILKLDETHTVKYCSEYKNIEITNNTSDEKRFMNIHEFIHTHCRDYLIGYAKGFKTKSEARYSTEDSRIVELYFDIFITVPNLTGNGDVKHTETFSGLSELMVYVEAVEWLMKYRKDNPKLSKFWVSIV